jgi:hypothetical protein
MKGPGGRWVVEVEEGLELLAGQEVELVMGVDRLEEEGCMVWVCHLQEHFLCYVHEYYAQLLLNSSGVALPSYSKSGDFSCKLREY